ncbi:unnamed protein product, partial [Protopolystoma xenopodis]
MARLTDDAGETSWNVPRPRECRILAYDFRLKLGICLVLVYAWAPDSRSTIDMIKNTIITTVIISKAIRHLTCNIKS